MINDLLSLTSSMHAKCTLSACLVQETISPLFYKSGVGQAYGCDENELGFRVIFYMVYVFCTVERVCVFLYVTFIFQVAQPIYL